MDELTNIEIALKHFQDRFPIDQDGGPTVVGKTINAIEMPDGTVTITFGYLNRNEKINFTSKDYSPTHLDNLRYPEQMQRLSAILNVSLEDAYHYFSQFSPDDEEKINRLKDQRCVECDQLIKRHFSADWRFSLHQIRCSTCAGFLMVQLDVLEFEAFYVLNLRN